MDSGLHDAWAFRLRGGGEGRTLEDFRALIRYERFDKMSGFVGWLFRLRLTLGRRFGWDDEKRTSPESSFVHRLTDDDRAGSLDEPGGRSGIMGVSSRVVYTFENEELHEIVNVTGHHFLSISMEPAPGGYVVLWGIYTKKTSWLTPMYMVLIDPFRRMAVYPAIIWKLEGAWDNRYGDQTAGRAKVGTSGGNGHPT